MEAIPEGVGLGVPGELAPNRVGDGSDKLPTQSEVCTQDTGKILRAVSGVGYVPLELVHQRYVSDMNVELLRCVCVGWGGGGGGGGGDGEREK